MDPFTFSLLLGGAGLGAMALTGVVRGGHGHGHAGHGHGHAGHGHGAADHGQAASGHGAHGHSGPAHGPASNGPASHGHVGDGGQAHGATPATTQAGSHAGDSHAGHSHAVQGGGHSVGQTLLALASPRILFSLALGFGTAGVLLERVLGGPLLLGAAALGAVAFERLLVTPIWNLGFRFESRPAFTLESSVAGEATAVTAFDAEGRGLIAIELDGQVVQLLGTLQRTDQEMGVRVRPGSRLRVEEVDTARNRCTVSLL